MEQVRYREYALGAPLDSSVACVWTLTQRAGPTAVQRIPPDGCVEAIFHLDQPFDQLDNGAAMRQPAALIVGVWTGPIALASPASFDTLGIRFRPGCASTFLPHAGALANGAFDAGSVWGRDAASLRDQLGDSRDDAARVAAVRRFLLARRGVEPPLIHAAVTRIARSGGRVSIDALARHTGVTHRRLERAFQEHVGVPAKTLCRIARFQNVLRRRAPESSAGWAELAIACGYVDQSHMIRDFRQFAGETPAQLVAADASLADYFRRR